MAGEPSGDLVSRRGGSLWGSGPGERPGGGGGWVGGLALRRASGGEGGTERRAGLEQAGASGSRAAFTAELGPASPLPLLGPSSRQAAVSTDAAESRAALRAHGAPIELQKPSWQGGCSGPLPLPCIAARGPFTPLWSILGWTRSVPGGGERDGERGLV